jgi:flagellar hook protein FlgE
MSISSAMLAGVTGLTTNSSELAAISDNIANANTVGYKRHSVDFETLVNSSSKTSYSAGGVAGLARQYVSTQGTVQSSGSNTDLAISGDGFFVTTNKTTGLTPSDPRYFTRAGSFTLDNAGYLRNSAGLYLQGWPADVLGNVQTDSSNLQALSPINILSVANTAQASNKAAIQANLDSDQAQNALIGTYDPVFGSMADYAQSNGVTGLKPDFSVSLPISDSKGGQRSLVVDFLKSPTPNQWYAEIRADPPNAIENDGSSAAGFISSGIVAFKEDGSLDTTNTTLPSAIDLLSSSSASPPAAGTVKWATSYGVAPQNISLDLTGMSQFAAVSAVSSVSTNGTAFGAMTGLNVDQSGWVTAVYGNGVTRRVAQIAVATFPNENGLISLDGNAYQVSTDSGRFTLKSPGSAGAGTLSAGSLEASTVDLSSEFTGLITTQRAYAASSKIITTADQMLQDLLDIKR